MRRNALGIGVALVGLLLLSTQAEATPVEVGDAYNIAFSAETCSSCSGTQVFPSVTIEGLLTVEPVTGGTFWDPLYSAYFSSALMVVGLTGTLSIDCQNAALTCGLDQDLGGLGGSGSYSLSFLAANSGGDGWSAPLGDGSWLLGDAIPRYVVFAGEGSGLNTRFINDNAYNLFEWGSPATQFGSEVPVTWSTTRVPEPASSLLFAFGLIGVMAVRRHRLL